MNTEVSYQRDLKKLAAFLNTRGIQRAEEVHELDLEAYLQYMENGKFASSSISRSVASIRAFFQYLQKEGKIPTDVSENLRSPKVEKSFRKYYQWKKWIVCFGSRI